MSESKVLLFIVEGKTDENALAPALEQIVTSSAVKFKVMHADITCDYDSTIDNIERRIKELGVKKFLQSNPQFTARDICGIVHVVDTDGAFASDELVFEEKTDSVKYCESMIICKNKELYLKTKHNKKNNLLHLSQLNSIAIPFGVIVPYSIFYMSCNLDHVLHNTQNATTEEKIENSILFADKYDDPVEFERFFGREEINVPGDYSETWKYIQNDNRSLKRCSNFSLCIEKYKSKQKIEKQ